MTASKATKTYLYSPLSAHPNSIRLLRLLPASNDQDPIHCEIFDYSLTNPPRTSHLYECLSYVWGDIGDRPTILIDSAELAVTKNLHGALQRLRDPQLDRILWVDAVCINQDDIIERAQQVHMMAMIYAYASRVVVWLGDEADGSKEAIEYLREDASRVYRRQRKGDFERGGGEESQMGDSASREQPLKPMDGGERHAKQSARDKTMLLIKRPWFRRIWVLQEIAAARATVVLCGPEELPGACFFWGAFGVMDWCDDPSIRSTVSSILYLLGDASFLRPNELRDGEPFRLHICPLSHLIDMFRLREATDRRDKVFALLGIMSQDSSQSNIVPDYDMAWSGLFQNLVREILGKKVEATWISNNGKEFGHVSGKGSTVGYINEVHTSKNDRQVVSIIPTYHCDPMAHYQSNVASLEWTLHNSADAVRPGDIVCWLEGSTGATIIRPQGNWFMIVVVLASLPDTPGESLFYGGRHLALRSSHDNGNDKCATPINYNRNLHLFWTFDAEQAAKWSHASPVPENHPNELNEILYMAQVLEDVNDAAGIESLIARKHFQFDTNERASASMADHLRNLRQILPNWFLYLELKRDLQQVLCGEGFSSGPSSDMDLDFMELQARLVSNPGNGTKLLKMLFDNVCSVSASMRKLAFLLDVWGHTFTQDTLFELVEFVERVSLNQRTTLGHFPSSLYMEVVDILVRSTAQRPEWGKPFIQRLLHFAIGDANRIHCLLRSLIICTSIATPDWKITVVDAIFHTHPKDMDSAIANQTAWISLQLDARYKFTLDVLWSLYILPAKDFVGISPSGNFQRRSDLLQKFIHDFDLWQACYEGRIDYVLSDATSTAQDMPVLCRDGKGKWWRACAFEAAAMNGHVECCKALLKSDFGHPVSRALWVEIYERRSVPNAELLAELMGGFDSGRWEVTDGWEESRNATFRSGKRSETW